MRNCLISPSLLTHNIYRLIRDVLVPEKTRELGDLITVVNRSDQKSEFSKKNLKIRFLSLFLMRQQFFTTW